MSGLKLVHASRLLLKRRTSRCYVPVNAQGPSITTDALALLFALNEPLLLLTLAYSCMGSGFYPKYLHTAVVLH